MKSSKKTSVILLSILMSAGWSAHSFGMGPKLPQEIDYSAFQGQFKLMPSDKPCQELSDFEFLADATNHRVTLKFDNSQNWIGQFEHINQGRIPFNSCFSDGLIGYVETVGSGTKIFEKTVFLNPGILCQGGSEKARSATTIELNGDTVTLDVTHTEYQHDNFRCIFKRK